MGPTKALALATASSTVNQGQDLIGCGRAISSVAIPDSPGKQDATPIRAELSGSDRCRALGIEARSPAPVLALCRLLLAAGLDPARALEAYRGAVLCLRVRSIAEGAALEIGGDGVGFRPASRVGTAPPIAPAHEGAV
jgi:hypothetical protein